jgi:lipopolysaccharide transport system permease protein
MAAQEYGPVGVGVLTALRRDVREVLTELVEYRELLFQMAKRDLLLRYKQTAMGFGWAVFVPLVNTAVFSVIFVRVAPMETSVPYPLFAYCGLLAWSFFASSQRFAVTSLSSNINLVTKVYLPREVFPISTVLVCLVDFAVGWTVLVALMAYYGVGPSATIFWLPVVVLVHVAFTLSVALIVAMANLFYRDVKYLFEIVLTVWMFATSVVYPTSLVGGRLADVLALNPMTPIIDGYRAALFGGPSPATPAFLVAGLVSVTLLCVAWLTFHRAEYTFAENV